MVRFLKGGLIRSVVRYLLRSSVHLIAQPILLSCHLVVWLLIRDFHELTAHSGKASRCAALLRSQVTVF